MNDFGYVEGRDFVMEWRFVAGDFRVSLGGRRAYELR